LRKRIVKLNLANLLVGALIGYWNVSVAEESLATAKISLGSTTEIRNLVARKLSLGLSDSEELQDWNSKQMQSKNVYDYTEKALYDAKLAVVRTLNLESGTDIPDNTAGRHARAGAEGRHGEENRPDKPEHDSEKLRARL
jgi:hypothetical protein